MKSVRHMALRRLLAASLVVGAGCGEDASSPPRSGGPPLERPTLPTDYRPSGNAAAGAVFVHLFEWGWTDIARECETHLGPAGYQAVQVSPPQEHIVIGGRPWWERYQPVSYSIDQSRSGTGAEFVDMVHRCAAAGVDIYVDAVINHMTAGAGVGTAGTEYTKYQYPGLWDAADFHPPCTVTDYQRAANVQDCELLGLADLNTGLGHVRDTLAGYLVDLTRMGVAGFRIDAAKHMQPVELDSILDRANERVEAEGGELPYYFAEVIDHGGEAVEARDYYGLAYSSGGTADITEFRFRGTADKFSGAGGQKLAELETFSPLTWRLMPADKAVVFVQNHDTQRHGGGVTYLDGDVYRLAHVWMLAQPYGYPKIMSGYAFHQTAAGRDAGPPVNPDGTSGVVTCAARMELAVAGEWVCEHRDPVIEAMVGFRRAVAGTVVTGWWDNGGNAIAFSRGELGFVAINMEGERVDLTVMTGLPPGAYCDILSGGSASMGCAGTTVVVDADGLISLRLDAGTAVAVHAGAVP